MALSLDGNVLANNTGTSVSGTLTTSNSNDVIIATIISNSPATSVTASGLTFTEVSGLPVVDGSNNYVDFWWAPAASPLSSLSITANMSASTYVTIILFGISGANTSTPFDGSVVTGAGTGTSVSISTTASNTFIFGTCVDHLATPSGTFTEIQTQTQFNFTEYAIFSSPQTSLTVGTSAANKTWAAIAVKAATAGAAWTPVNRISRNWLKR